jgi:hypothetical protein
MIGRVLHVIPFIHSGTAKQVDAAKYKVEQIVNAQKQSLNKYMDVFKCKGLS